MILVHYGSVRFDRWARVVCVGLRDRLGYESGCRCRRTDDPERAVYPPTGEMMTKAEAIALYNTEWWKGCTSEEIVGFQMNEDRLCIPFAEFQKAAEAVMGRPVWTHEFAHPQELIAEMEGRIPRKTFADVVALLPADKVVVVTTDKPA